MILHLALLRSAALLVPRPQRADWMAEWSSELCYVTRRPTAFCLGAFCDAFWLRRNCSAPDASRCTLDSPVRCILLLALLASATVFFSFRLPPARNLLLPSPYRNPDKLAMISAEGRFGASVPTVSVEHYRLLNQRMRGVFAGLAFYSPVPAHLGTAELHVALASRNLFELLGIPAPTAAGPALILSYDAWREHFHGDPQIVGRSVPFAGYSASVAGLLPEGVWRLPGRVDAWLLTDQLPPGSLGFVLGCQRTASSDRWPISLGNESEGDLRFECVSLAKSHLVFSCTWMTLLAMLLLSTHGPLGLGEYPSNRHSPSGATRSRRWLFLVLKVALLLPIVSCGSLDLAALTSLDLLPPITLAVVMAAFYWALTDQRQRCPVCLRLLSNPTRIGGASHAFLEWYGTELMCAEGHGLLYVPEIPTSCYSTQRWQYLDPSWSSVG